MLLRLVVAVLLVAGHSVAIAGDWPQFLGPHRNGVSDETGLMVAWPKNGPHEAWRIKAGVGMSGIAVADGRAITLVQTNEGQQAVAVAAETGKPLWTRTIVPAFANNMGDGPRATPALVKDGVYVFTGDGVLAAVKPDTGELIWKSHLLELLQGEVADYGMACSPLVVGDLVVVTVGAPDAAIVAVDRKSGKLAWKAGNGPAGYSSPAVLRLAGRDQLVAFLGDKALGLDPSTGKSLWEHPYVTDFNCNIATPLAVDGQVLLSAGENHGSVLLALEAQGDAFGLSEVWSSQGAKSVLRNEWQTSVLLNDFLYGFDNVGSAGPVTHLTCVEAKSGKRAWQQLRFGKGNLIAADGKLFISTMTGHLVVVQASSNGFAELGRKPVVESTRQAPSLANGLLYLRDNAEILCIDVRKP